MKRSILAWVFLFTVAFVGLAEAAIITVAPADINITTGESFSVDLRLSDFGTAPIVGYDMGVNFDPSLIGFNDLAFGGAFGTGADVFTIVDDSVPGTISFVEFSFLDNNLLTALQGTDFLLAKLTFKGLAYGTSSLMPFMNEMVNADIEELSPSVIGGTVNIRSNGGQTPVPEPGTLLLLGSGLIGLTAYHRRVKGAFNK
jgi:hypothetical protein